MPYAVGRAHLEISARRVRAAAENRKKRVAACRAAGETSDFSICAGRHGSAVHAHDRMGVGLSIGARPVAAEAHNVSRDRSPVRGEFAVADVQAQRRGDFDAAVGDDMTLVTRAADVPETAARRFVRSLLEPQPGVARIVGDVISSFVIGRGIAHFQAVGVRTGVEHDRCALRAETAHMELPRTGSVLAADVYRRIVLETGFDVRGVRTEIQVVLSVWHRSLLGATVLDVPVLRRIPVVVNLSGEIVARRERALRREERDCRRYCLLSPLFVE